MLGVNLRHGGLGNRIFLATAKGGTGSGSFWIVKECLGLTVSQTLRTWTVTETIVGIAGLLLTLVVHSVWQVFQH